MITVKITGLDALQKKLSGLEKQVKKAASAAINQTAKEVRHRTVQEFEKQFRNPTPFTKRAMRVKDWASPNKLQAVVELRQDDPAWPRALAHHFTGGPRQWKKFEGALMRIGVLPAGMAAVPAKGGWAVRLDRYGNMSAGQITQILAYFQAFGEQGYQANMTAEGRRKLARIKGKGAGTKSGSPRITGWSDCVSRGRGNWFGNRSWANGRMQHLPPGIWAKKGTHGVDVAPVLMFVRRGNYRKRIDLETIGREVVAKNFNKNFSDAMAHEVGGVS